MPSPWKCRRTKHWISSVRQTAVEVAMTKRDSWASAARNARSLLSKLSASHPLESYACTAVIVAAFVQLLSVDLSVPHRVGTERLIVLQSASKWMAIASVQYQTDAGWL